MFDAISRLTIDWLLKRPAILRAVFTFANAHRRIFRSGSTFVVLGHHEVIQVLSNHTDFTLAPIMTDRFPSGEFLLSMDECAQYLRDKNKMTRSFHGTRYDLIKDIEQFSYQRSAAILKQFEGRSKNAQIDLVGGLAEQVAADVIFQLVIGYTEKAPEDFVTALRWLARLIISGQYDKPRMKRHCDISAAVINRYLERRLQGKGPWRVQSVVNEMLEQGCDTLEIKRFVGGMAAAGVATVARATGQAINELLHRPNAMRITRAAVECGDPATVLQCCMEALRYNPMLSMIPRHCERDTVIHCLDGQKVPIHKGSYVMVGLYFAMFDRRAFPDPERFMINRPLKHYLHFGEGLHRCFGESMAQAQITQITMAVFNHLPKFERSKRIGHGYLEFEGPALKHLWVSPS